MTLSWDSEKFLSSAVCAVFAMWQKACEIPKQTIKIVMGTEKKSMTSWLAYDANLWKHSSWHSDESSTNVLLAGLAATHFSFTIFLLILQQVHK